MTSSGGLQTLQDAWPYGISGWLYYPIVEWGMTEGFFIAVLVALCMLTLGWAVKPYFRPEVDSGRGDRIFYVLLFFTILWGRWPSFVPVELNPDESQSVAGASLLWLNPIPFVGADGTTHGPLLYAPILIGKLFGLPLDWGLARAVGLAACCLTLYCVFLLLRHYYDSGTARVTVGFLGVFEATTSSSGMLAYSSEMIPMAILFLVLVVGWGADRSSLGLRTRGAISGLLLSSLAYIKLQFVPIGMLVGVAWIWYAWRRSDSSKSFAKTMGILAAGTLLLPTIMTLLVVANDGWSDFWKGYILANRVYTEHVRIHGLAIIEFLPKDQFPLTDRLDRTISTFAVTKAELRRFVQCTGAVAALLVLLLIVDSGPHKRLKSKEWEWLLPFLGATGVLAASYLVIILPGNAYGHYFRLIFAPTGYWLGCLIGEWRKTEKLDKLPVLLLLPLLLPFFVERVNLTGESWKRLPAETVFRLGQDYLRAPPLKDGPAEILMFARPGERVGVWGWRPDFNVLTLTYPATRDIVGERLMEQRFDLNFYRERYLRELKANSPPVFVDAVGGFMYNDHEKYGLHIFPELQSYLRENYSLQVEQPLYRVWVRNERLAELKS